MQTYVRKNPEDPLGWYFLICWLIEVKKPIEVLQLLEEGIMRHATYLVKKSSKDAVNNWVEAEIQDENIKAWVKQLWEKAEEKAKRDSEQES